MGRMGYERTIAWGYGLTNTFAVDAECPLLSKAFARLPDEIGVLVFNELAR